MTTLHATSAPSVEGTLNVFFIAQLAAFTLPSDLTLNSTIVDWPDQEMPTPCFSIVHFPVLTRQQQYANRADHLIEIDAWIDRYQNVNWSYNLRFMAGMVNQVVNSNKTVVLTDYVTDINNPTTTQYVVRLGDIDEKLTLPEKNNAIERRRFLIGYWWHLRS